MFKLDYEKYTYIVLLVLIFVGIGVRFWSLDSGLLWRDEGIHFIAALKLNHHDPSIQPIDPRFWHAQYPPVGTYVMGLPSLLVLGDYSEIIKLDREWPLLYLSTEILKQTYYGMRLMSSLAGLFTVLLVFLITRSIWGNKPALWSAAITSLSVDFIAISRVAFLEVYMITFFLASLYFTIRYIKTEDVTEKFVYAILSAFFVILTLGTRWGTPFIIFPVLFTPLLLLSKERARKNFLLFFAGLLALAWIVFYYFVNLPATVKVLTDVIGAQEALFVFSAPYFLGSFLFKNSYLFLAGLMVSLFAFGKFLKKFGIQGIIKYFQSPDTKLVIYIFLIICLGFFSFTLFGENPRYFLIAFVPAIILIGKPLSDTTKNHLVIFGLMILVIVNIYTLFAYFPYYTSYGNFGISNYQILNYDSPYDLIPEQQQILEFLNEQENPKIFTNLPNLLLFYKGNSELMPPYNTNFKASELCKTDLKELVKDSYVIILANDWIFCLEFENVEFDFIKEYGKTENGKRFGFGTISIFKAK